MESTRGTAMRRANRSWSRFVASGGSSSPCDEYGTRAPFPPADIRPVCRGPTCTGSENTGNRSPWSASRSPRRRSIFAMPYAAANAAQRSRGLDPTWTHAARRFPLAILIVGAPLALAVLEVFHPHPGDLLALDVRTWLAVHLRDSAVSAFGGQVAARSLTNDAAATICQRRDVRVRRDLHHIRHGCRGGDGNPRSTQPESPRHTRGIARSDRRPFGPPSGSSAGSTARLPPPLCSPVARGALRCRSAPGPPQYGSSAPASWRLGKSCPPYRASESRPVQNARVAATGAPLTFGGIAAAAALVGNGEGFREVRDDERRLYQAHSTRKTRWTREPQPARGDTRGRR